MRGRTHLIRTNGPIPRERNSHLEAFGHIVIAWMWLEQFVAASGSDGGFYDGKRHAARYFFAFELPRTTPQLDLLQRLDRTTLEMRAEWF